MRFAMEKGFIKKINNSKNFYELIKRRPTAYVLLSLIADRAKRQSEDNFNDLKIGQCYIGDYKTYGVTEQVYRTDKLYLEKWHFSTFKGTGKGTIATLHDNSIFDINPRTDQRPVQRTANGQLTTNKNDKNEKRETAPLLSKLEYLQNIPTEDMDTLLAGLDCSRKQLLSKAEDLFNYCVSKGKMYRNYKLFLRGALKRDFPPLAGIKIFNPKI